MGTSSGWVLFLIVFPASFSFHCFGWNTADDSTVFMPRQPFQRHQAANVVGQVLQADLGARLHDANRSHDPTARRVLLRSEHMLDASAYPALGWRVVTTGSDETKLPIDASLLIEPKNAYRACARRPQDTDHYILSGPLGEGCQWSCYLLGRKLVRGRWAATP